MKLTHYLCVHLVGWTVAVSGIAAAWTVLETRRELERTSHSLAQAATRVLESQLARIALGAELDRSFPDWGLVEGLRLPPGTCLRLLRQDGSVWRSSCHGADLARTTAPPDWFVALHERWPGSLAPVVRTLSSPAAASAQLTVSVEAREQRAGAWRAMNATMLVATAVAGALALVALIVVARATQPLRRILVRIDELERGRLAGRLGRVRFTELQRVASALDRLAASLTDALGQQRRLAAELISAQEQERRRLARELHDEFGQHLAGIAALTGAVRSDVAAGRTPPAADLARIATAAADMQQQLRELLDQLGPAALDELGLGPALASLAAEWHTRCRGRPAFSVDSDDALSAQLAPGLAITVYRIAQEALTNAARHARATRVTLRLACVADTRLVLSVDDDGTAGSGPLVPGRGLTGMRERVEALGGRLEWRRLPTGGVGVRAELPLVSSRDA